MPGDGETPSPHRARRPTSSAARRPDAIALLSLWGLITITFAEVLFFRAAFYDRDTFRFYYPTKRIIREIVHAGEFPVWNPYYSAGQPLAANPEYEVFYPLQWPILLPDYHFGFSLHILLHLYLAASGMYLLLRSRDLSILASLFGSIAFALGGWMVSSASSLLPILFGAAWIPLILYFAIRCVEHDRLSDYALASICMGMQLLTGEPVTLLQSGILLVLFSCWAPGQHSRPDSKELLRRIAISTAVGATAFLIAAVQILPALDLVPDTVRGAKFPFERVASWSLHPARILEWAFPHLFGIASADVDRYWGSRLYPDRGYPFMLSIYFGIAALAVAVGGWIARIRGWVFFLTLVSASYAIALGSHTPLLRLLYDAGLAINVRYPEKFLLIAVVAIAIFAAIALDRIESGNRKVAIHSIVFLSVTTLVAIGMWIDLARSPRALEQFVSMWQLPRDGTTAEWLRTSVATWRAAAVRGLVALVMLAIARRWPRVGVAGLTAALAFDLSRLAHFPAPTKPEAFFTSPPRIARSISTGDRNSFRIFHAADWFSQRPIGQQYLEIPGARYWVFRNGLFPRTPAIWGYRSVLEPDYDLTNLATTQQFVDSMWRVRDAGQRGWMEMFSEMSNARYVALYRSLLGATMIRSFAEIDPIAFVTPRGPAPRYSFAQRAVPIRDADDFTHRLARGEWSPGTAFVLEPIGEVGEGEVHTVSERSSSVRLDVTAENHALLVASVTHHKYWKASIDGNEARILRTNLAYIGIVVPAGRHVVTLRYWNPWIARGALISATTLASLAILLSWVGFRRRGILRNSA